MDIEISKADLQTTRVVDTPTAELAEGEARLAVRRFGFSANNITYAVFGDLMAYWHFFPAEEGWGRVPVWGFAEVAESNNTGLEAGELIYGYLPMGAEFVVAPTKVSEGTFIDASTHRSALPVAYNGYTRCAADPAYSVENEPLQMLFGPLFMTDFVLDDYLADDEEHEAFFGASQIILSSASSKTAFGLAHLLSQRDGLEVVGLTSAGRVEFVEGLGFYDRVVTYDQIESLAGDHAAVYVDMAGDGGVRHAVHSNLPGLAASIQVGGTHWADLAAEDELPGPVPALFFAPTQIVKRRDDWGPGGFEERYGAAWTTYLPLVRDMITVVERNGADAVVETYLEVLSGEADASQAFVLSLD